MASTPSVKGNDVEMTVSPSFSSTDQKDELALARLGKKAVLKVSTQECIYYFADQFFFRGDSVSSQSWGSAAPS